MNLLLLCFVVVVDLVDLYCMVVVSVDVISLLFNDEVKLCWCIEVLLQVFVSLDDVSGEEIYFFVLEDCSVNYGLGCLVGCFGIVVSVGFFDWFYSYCNEFVVYVSMVLGVLQCMYMLYLCYDLIGVMLLILFYLEFGYEQGFVVQLFSCV